MAKLIETGVHGAIAQLAAVEKVNPSYISRLLRLTLLAPTTVESILNGRRLFDTTLGRFKRPFPAEWTRQPL